MIFSRLLYRVVNGNSFVELYDNGTRRVRTIDRHCNYIELDLPLSLDINISNRCSNGCPYCYAGNTPTGNVADLLDMNYLNGISGIEIAINIQYPLPENFKLWLEMMRQQNIIVNGTINQLDFERDINTLYAMKELKRLNLLHGLGISFRKYDETLYQTIKEELGDDVVVHVIVGITPIDDIIKLLNNNFKVLILGYKQKNRGIDYFANANIEAFKNDIDRILNYNFKSVIAFDTAGLKQLDIKNKISEEQWNNSYQGDEGTISFYIDAVNKTFNIDSHTTKEPINIDNLSLKEMFSIIKDKAGSKND